MSAPTVVGQRDPEKAWAYKKDVAWYRTELSEETIGPMRPILELYSKVPPESVVEWIKTVRDKAWEVYPYGTIGMFGFLTLSLPTHPSYPDILASLQSGKKTFLDIGCCVGQELRSLTYAGVPSENLYGVDLHQGFLDIGYELFRDSETLKSTLLAADVFDENSEVLKDVEGKIDVVHAGSFFHLFDWDQQVTAAKRVVRLLRPQPGSILVGKQAGDVNAGQKSRPGKLGSRYRHNAESWKKLWQQVAAETGTQWEVSVRELEDKEYFREMTGGVDLAKVKSYGDWNPETTRRIEFLFRRA
uniref:O-methyltransferase phiE n=1 Tax=Fungal sp. (strain ATCC 74256) TaxID=1729595 RepID=PHIE_FUNX7|nr:RecName: Full=O-methyltransferase phiE; AltName: Full=Phomoidride biosynthesis cluster protein E [fungal sp. ATCC 74256]BBG28502.1 putative methyltransferase [fungal sp. ATCC 74256]